MNAMDLLYGLNNVRDSYVVAAGAFRQRKPKRLPKRKLWLIAALIALTLLLVGCAVVYVLRLQDLKVGEYRFYVPAAYDENGGVIPVETREPFTVLSVQGSNMEALAEWVAFTNVYDLDGTIALEADLAAKSGTPWDIPEDHARTYGCYSREMVNKLDEIAEKYHLKLLSGDIPFNEYENSILFRSLGLDSLVQDAPHVQVEYGDGYFHLEGTFSLHMRLAGDFGVWQWEDGGIYFHYSRKDYFDPTTSSMQESQSYTQWDYTRQDGKTVLLVLGTEDARIYADLPDAFVSIDITPEILENGKKIPMTREALQQLAEPRYANVLRFDALTGLVVRNVKVGHTVDAGVCSGGVIQLNNVNKSLIEGCKLYGCGILGVQGIYCNNLSIFNCEIYECSSGAASFHLCNTVRVEQMTPS